MAGTQQESGGRKGGRSKPSTAIVRSVERAARIVDAIYRTPAGKRVADLSEELRLPRTTVLRLVRTLEAAGFVERDEDSDTYHRNPGMWLTACCDLANLGAAADTVDAVLREVEQETGLAGSLAVPDPARRAMIMIAWYVPLSALGGRGRDRWALPMHATAVGHVYLASLPASQLHESMKQGLARYTDDTVTSPRRLTQELARVRKQGYAVCRNTFAKGRFAVAVPVRDAKGRTIAAISLGGPQELHTEANVRRWLPHMREASERLAALLQVALPGASGE